MNREASLHMFKMRTVSSYILFMFLLFLTGSRIHARSQIPLPPAAERTESEVCSRWKELQAPSAINEGTWNGDGRNCNVGMLSEPGPSNALNRMNYFRWLAGLPLFQMSSTMNKNAQQCALIMHANQTISHNPDPAWKCYSVAGAQTAGKSSLATAAAVNAISLYLWEGEANKQSMGHRRWLLSPWISEVGIGGTPSYSCLQVVGGNMNYGSGPQFIAFPSPGISPKEVFDYASSVGWTIQSDSIDFRGGRLKVKDVTHNKTLKVGASFLDENYGSTYGLLITFAGITLAADSIYEITFTSKINVTIKYQVQFKKC